MATEETDTEGVSEEELLAALDQAAEARPDLGEHFENVSRYLASRKWGELEVIEHAGYLLFPDEIQRRVRGGKFEAKPVMVRVPRGHEMRKARATARELFKKDEHLDPIADRDLFDKFENLVILSIAIRNTSDPYEPLVGSVKELEHDYDLMSLKQVWEKLDAYNAMLNPQPELFTRPQFIALVAAIAEGRSIVPLDAISLDARGSFVITMAVLLHSFLASKSSSVSSGTSTPAASPTQSSSSSADTASPAKEESRS